VDALVAGALAALGVVEGEALGPLVTEKAELLALVAGQDVEQGADGVFRIARKVARDRVISTVDTAARHGHKSRARTFDGERSHVSLDPESELIAEVMITAGNAADRDVVDELIATDTTGAVAEQVAAGQVGALTVMGDSAYADGKTLDRLTAAGHVVMAKVPPVRNTTGGFAKDAFTIDLSAGTVTCPAAHSVPIVPVAAGGGRATFGKLCSACPLRAQCTKAKAGRVVAVHPHELALQKARVAQKDPAWQEVYRATRPKVERKISHLTRRPWGGRRARCRGSERNLTDLLTRAVRSTLPTSPAKACDSAPPVGQSPKSRQTRAPGTDQNTAGACSTGATVRPGLKCSQPRADQTPPPPAKQNPSNRSKRLATLRTGR